MNINLILILAISITIAVPVTYGQIVPRTLDEVDSGLRLVEQRIENLTDSTRSLQTQINEIPTSLSLNEFQLVTEGNFVPSKRNEPHRFEADCGGALAISGRVIVLDVNMVNDFVIYQITTQNDPVHRVSYEFYNNSPNNILPLQFITDCVEIRLQ